MDIVLNDNIYRYILNFINLKYNPLYLMLPNQGHENKFCQRNLEYVEEI